MTSPREVAACSNCPSLSRWRCRGLCWRCYRIASILARFPLGKHENRARRGIGGYFCASPKLPEPTGAAPGTPEKVAVMAHRAEAGLALFHPNDARRT